MANFNAGTIEATLTLDRSDFTKDLKAAQAQAKAFEKNRINVELDVDGEAELAELRAKLKAIPDEKVTVEVDVDKDSTKNILGSTRALNGMRFAIAGVAGALPAFVPAIAGAAAVIVSLAGAAGIAGAGLAAFALVAAPAMDRVKKALKEADGDIKKLPKSLQALATAQANFQKTQKKLGENAGVYATLAAGYNLLSTVLRQLSPVITAVSSVLTVLITKLDTWAKSDRKSVV